MKIFKMLKLIVTGPFLMLYELAAGPTLLPKLFLLYLGTLTIVYFFGVGTRIEPHRTFDWLVAAAPCLYFIVDALCMRTLKLIAKLNLKLSDRALSGVVRIFFLLSRSVHVIFVAASVYLLWTRGTGPALRFLYSFFAGYLVIASLFAFFETRSHLKRKSLSW